jgi:hypothetical protein
VATQEKKKKKKGYMYFQKCGHIGPRAKKKTNKSDGFPTYTREKNIKQGLQLTCL